MARGGLQRAQEAAGGRGTKGAEPGLQHGAGLEEPCCPCWPLLLLNLGLRTLGVPTQHLSAQGPWVRGARGQGPQTPACFASLRAEMQGEQWGPRDVTFAPPPLCPWVSPGGPGVPDLTCVLPSSARTSRCTFKGAAPLLVASSLLLAARGRKAGGMLLLAGATPLRGCRSCCGPGGRSSPCRFLLLSPWGSSVAVGGAVPAAFRGAVGATWVSCQTHSSLDSYCMCARAGDSLLPELAMGQSHAVPPRALCCRHPGGSWKGSIGRGMPWGQPVHPDTQEKQTGHCRRLPLCHYSPPVNNNSAWQRPSMELGSRACLIIQSQPGAPAKRSAGEVRPKAGF